MTNNKLKLIVSTPRRTVKNLEGVDMVGASGEMGDVAILPNHAPFLTKLKPGIVKYRVGDKNYFMALEGAFMEVSRNCVSILADRAILPEEADERRAEEARKRAEEVLKKKLAGTDFRQVEAEMRRLLLELKLVEHTK